MLSTLAIATTEARKARAQEKIANNLNRTKDNVMKEENVTQFMRRLKNVLSAYGEIDDMHAEVVDDSIGCICFDYRSFKEKIELYLSMEYNMESNFLKYANIYFPEIDCCFSALAIINDFNRYYNQLYRANISESNALCSIVAFS